jgi:hypothetical protein
LFVGHLYRKLAGLFFCIIYSLFIKLYCDKKDNSNVSSYLFSIRVILSCLNSSHTRAAFSQRSGSSPDRRGERQHRHGSAVASLRKAVESPRTPMDGVCVLLQITNAMGSLSLEKRNGNAKKSP